MTCITVVIFDSYNRSNFIKSERVHNQGSKDRQKKMKISDQFGINIPEINFEIEKLINPNSEGSLLVK